MITVIDNALEDPLFKSIKDIVDNTFLPWYLGNDINDTKKWINGIQTPQLVHTLFYNIKETNIEWKIKPGINITSPHTNFVHKLIAPVLEKNKIYGDISQSKFNLLFPHPKVKNNSDHNVIHIDLDEPHYAITYYLNDSDGDTVFFKDDFTELKRVKPKENRMVISESLYHASSNPIKSSFRKVLNMAVRKA